MMSPRVSSIPNLPFGRIHFERVGSTQDEARALVRAGARSGTLVIADEQTAGRGRDGHSWSSAPGLGLWLTLIHRSGRAPREWPILTSAGALAVCAAIEDAGLTPRIRWPNDVLIEGRKVSGILAETEADAILLGIGVNVLHVVEDFSQHLRQSATSIAIEMGRVARPAPDRGTFLEMILRPLAAIIAAFESAGSAEIVTGVWERSSLRGRHVEVLANDPAGPVTVAGRAVGLNDVGGLVLRGPDGTVEIVSGSIQDIRPEGP